MKKITIFCSVIVLLITLSACGNDQFDASQTINVYTRDTSSGTRDGFMKGIDFPDASGTDSVLVEGFSTNDNAGIMNAMTIDRYGIGYISMASVNDTIKALNLNDIEPTVENVNLDTYELKRPFVYMLRLENDYENTTMFELSKAFETFILSEEGSDVILDQGAISYTNKGTFNNLVDNHTICEQDNSDITLNIGGSNSVTKVAEALSASFVGRCGNVNVSHNHTGSSDAFKRTQGDEKDSANAIDFGFSSRHFRGEELDNDESLRGQLAWDAIVVIVHQDNPVDSLTQSQVKKIYSGDVTSWDELID